MRTRNKCYNKISGIKLSDKSVIQTIYGILTKENGGELKVETQGEKGYTLTIHLPLE